MYFASEFFSLISDDKSYWNFVKEFLTFAEQKELKEKWGTKRRRLLSLAWLYVIFDILHYTAEILVIQRILGFAKQVVYEVNVYVFSHQWSSKNLHFQMLAHVACKFKKLWKSDRTLTWKNVYAMNILFSPSNPI